LFFLISIEFRLKNVLKTNVIFRNIQN
jgi:hypothetical protein